MRTFLERYSQRRQSAKLFLQPSESGLPQPLSRTRGCPPPFGPGGGGGVGHTRLRERGWGSRNPTRGHTLWCAIYAYKYFVKVLHGRLLENLFKISTRRSKSNKFNTIALLKNLPYTNVPRCTLRYTNLKILQLRIVKKHRYFVILLAKSCVFPS
jgi:hypothetical protein